MIPEQQLVAFPEFANAGTKIAPEGAKYSEGFQPGDVLPAEWLNYFMNKASAGQTTGNAVIDSLQKEMQNVVNQAGLTPSGANNTQVFGAIKNFIKGNTLAIMCATAANVQPAATGYGFVTEYYDGLSLKVTVKNGYYAATSGTVMTFGLNDLGGKKIYVAKQGVLSTLGSVSLDRGDGTKNWFIQPFTTLELEYDSTLDDSAGGWILTNNPVVLSKSDATNGYTIYADGRERHRVQRNSTSSAGGTVSLGIDYSKYRVTSLTCTNTNLAMLPFVYSGIYVAYVISYSGINLVYVTNKNVIYEMVYESV